MMENAYERVANESSPLVEEQDHDEAFGLSEGRGVREGVDDIVETKSSLYLFLLTMSIGG